MLAEACKVAVDCFCNMLLPLKALDPRASSFKMPLAQKYSPDGVARAPRLASCPRLVDNARFRLPLLGVLDNLNKHLEHIESVPVRSKLLETGFG